VPFILSSICWEGEGRWVEPFLGSGTVLFNLAPRKALVADTNPHVIEFYRDITSGSLRRDDIGRHLEREGRLLSERGEQHYYEVRERFNARPSSLDLLFLNRACFNGVMRFNRKGGFNVPFCRKPERFNRAYITKITNQVHRVASLSRGRDWVFEVADWRETISKVENGDFVYADPPYSGRHVDYYNGWTDDESVELLAQLRTLPIGFALSTWKQNKHRRNPFLESAMADTVIRTTKHFYHVGSREDLRGEMEEALIVSKDFVSKHELTPQSDFR
jgi:DNA adenine methylase